MESTCLSRTAVNAGDQARAKKFLSSTSASADVGLIPASLCTDGNGFCLVRHLATAPGRTGTRRLAQEKKKHRR